MAHPHWPLFDLEVRTPRLTLRPVTDDMAVELAALAAQGIHDPARMPFGIPWTRAESPELERRALQFHWRCRADMSAERWSINFAVVVDGDVVGSTGLMADDFPRLRQFETGSWLGRAYQGRGIGTEMRLATLAVGFDGFEAEWATTGAWHDNAASLGVTSRLGYSPTGHRRMVRNDQAPDVLLAFEMSRAHYVEHLRRDDIELVGVEPVRELLGIGR
jgi:RimJ/RimL family protein N-acetyltransferase